MDYVIVGLLVGVIVGMIVLIGRLPQLERKLPANSLSQVENRLSAAIQSLRDELLRKGQTWFDKDAVARPTTSIPHDGDETVGHIDVPPGALVRLENLLTTTDQCVVETCGNMEELLSRVPAPPPKRKKARK